ncbi:hypothetical protein O181_076143 [Austropuccinia psidii MF-1]|uniref:Uncharacterized protein n=1 Tax=Austropuccinia psidii MF-1 TaxID=1389203 RepID=A0A9Q3FED2_9BASI|nr:hypothetical protein [Austropuccinia psidii MF-1]
MQSKSAGNLINSNQITSNHQLNKSKKHNSVKSNHSTYQSDSLTRHFPSSSTIESLKQFGIPLSSCQDCQLGHDSASVPFNLDGYPENFSIDTKTPLLGHIKPFDLLILCSSGKTDWPHDVCKDPLSIPGQLRKLYPKLPNSTKLSIPGIFPLPKHLQNNQINNSKNLQSLDSDQSLQQNLNLAILSSSHFSTSNNDQSHSLIILPDWVRITEVTLNNLPNFKENLQSSQTNQKQIQGNSKKSKLPYQVIILICSHKTRDKRCSISAGVLEEEMIQSIESNLEDWKVDCRGDYDLNHIDDDENWAGIFKVSHTGGHKFAGNMIINFPFGTSIWYGRVTKADCKRIVQETIISKNVIPELLKGGVGLNQLKNLPSCSQKNSLNW